MPTLSRRAAIILVFAQQLRELGDIRRNPLRLHRQVPVVL
jgi:hypothetical protein